MATPFSLQRSKQWLKSTLQQTVQFAIVWELESWPLGFSAACNPESVVSNVQLNQRSLSVAAKSCRFLFFLQSCMMDEAPKLVTDASLVESEWMLKTAAAEVDRILQYHLVSPRFAAMAVQQVMDTINTVCRSRGGHYSGYSCKAQLQGRLVDKWW